MSPVCRRNSGATGRALIFSTAAFRVPAASGVWGLCESLVGLPHLHEVKFAGGGCAQFFRFTEAEGTKHASVHHAKSPRTGPGHALQESAAVNAVLVVIDQKLAGISFAGSHGL